mmetsp:Transcript_22704/g.45432  ORF Transcript_22704/g.45432 Transcript_22704/m.45432 type:complete len:311 (-) Transcript_22704:174-1106(-)
MLVAAAFFVATVLQTSRASTAGNPSWRRLLPSAPRSGFWTSSTSPSEADDHAVLAPCMDGVDVSLYRVHGWRWHNLSAIRDLDRLAVLAGSFRAGAPSDGGDDEALLRAAEFVVDVNLGGLLRVETELFRPFLRRNLVEGGGADGGDWDRDARRSIGRMVDRWFGEDALGRYDAAAADLKRHAAAACAPGRPPAARRRSAQLLAAASGALHGSLHSRFVSIESLLVPAVALRVRPSLQEGFNSRVIRSLGVSGARVYLVGMHDAAAEMGEGRMFDAAIPAFARAMVGRWRERVYGPAGGLALYGNVTSHA